VIEAVFEQMGEEGGVQKARRGHEARRAAVHEHLGIDIDIMANVTKRPQDVAGTHFFAPANVMKLFEVVKGTKTAPDTRAAMKLGRDIGKISAYAGTCDGFVANRSRAPFVTEMNSCSRKARCPSRSTRSWSISATRSARSRSTTCPASTSATTRASAAPQPIPTTASSRSRPLVEMGRKGQKTGPAGIATSRATARRIPTPRWRRDHPPTSAELGIEQREFTDEEILRRLLFASVNEACKILEEGKACAPATSM
jgi:3-hydroxyacyl-CoA dehydrogenase